MNAKTMFSSKSIDWETPKEFFAALDAEFHFTLDPCASKANHKCNTYFTVDDDGLAQSWAGHNVFCNPPYGKTIGQWVKKAYEEAKRPNTVVVCLLPARTDTKYFHEYIYGNAEIRFVCGRLKFGKSKNSAPFPSMVCIWR